MCLKCHRATKFFLPCKTCTTSKNLNSAKALSKVRKRMRQSLPRVEGLQEAKIVQGEGSLVDGGPSLQERSITGGSMKMNVSLMSKLNQSSIIDDPTINAPLMCTRRLFGNWSWAFWRNRQTAKCLTVAARMVGFELSDRESNGAHEETKHGTFTVGLHRSSTDAYDRYRKKGSKPQRK